MKELLEKRNDMHEQLEGLLNKAKEEKRAFNDEELKKITDLKEEIRKIDESIKLEEEVRSIQKVEIKKPEIMTKEEVRAAEIRKAEQDFIGFLKEDRAALGNLTAGNNGVVIPTTIANMIVDKIKNLSPILAKATTWNLSGDLVIPISDFTQFTAAFVTEGTTDLTGVGTNFTSKTLHSKIVGALALVSRSLINRASGAVDVVAFVVNEVAKSIAYFLENELLNNTNAQFTGTLQSATQSYSTATTGTLTIQDLINAQMTVPQSLQQGCAWIFHPNMLASIQGLQAGAGSNLLIMGNNLSQDAPFTILGKPVYISDNAPNATASALGTTGSVFGWYGDFSGLHVKMTNGLEMQVLQERYAASYNVGVVAFCELDSVIAEPQKITILKSK